MKRILIWVAVLLFAISFSVSAVSTERNLLTDELKQQLYEWAMEGKGGSTPQSSFVYEDITGDATADNYRIYHVYSTDWMFADVIETTRIGDSLLTFSRSDKCFAVCEIKNGSTVGIYSLEDAYANHIIDDAALNKINDSCGVITVSSVLTESNLLTDELKQQLYEWAMDGNGGSTAQSSFVFEDVTGDAAAENYRIYHVYSTDWMFADVIETTRIGDSLLTFSRSDRGFAVCKIENRSTVRIYSLEDAYANHIIDDAALNKISDICSVISVSLIGDVNSDGRVNVVDIMRLKTLIRRDLWTQEALAIGDVNGNGVLDVVDIVLLKGITLKK